MGGPGSPPRGEDADDEPEDRGRVVTAFLSNFFERYVNYDFTANLEEQLDDISGGSINWKQVLENFWGAFSEAVADTKELRITEDIRHPIPSRID